jgi:anaerobic selenocysteine-containing dehydrogenase
MADMWLEVHPGTDGVLALSMLNVMIEENLYDYEFVRDWTNGSFLVRSDTGDLLKASELVDGGDPASYVVLDSKRGTPQIYIPGTVPPPNAVLDGIYMLELVNGKKVECKPVFRLLREITRGYKPDIAEEITCLAKDKIINAARTFATVKPSCWFSWNGIEQSTNASQTNRAICILYALTGNLDTPGGNVILPRLPVNPIDGRSFLNPEAEKKRLGFKERPLGPAGTVGSIQSYDVYRAILGGNPYPIKALIGFGGNLVMSNPPALLAKEALSKLDFHVQADLFLTPTAELADIVLPVASSWESWHVGVNVDTRASKSYIQLRPAVASPQHESWPDMKIIFELAKRLGMGDKFWGGNIEAGFNYQFAPSNVTVEELKMHSGIISIDLLMEYKKYNKKGEDNKFLGFSTPSRKIEIYSQTFKDSGYDPLPIWKEPPIIRSARTSFTEKYPLILTGGKVVEYCHSQHRAMPSLRKRVPHPFLEINLLKGKELGVKDGDWILLESPYGGITLQAKLKEGIPYTVVCTQHGWWQSCPELDLPGYDSYSAEGANVNLLYSTEEIDPISGSLPLKGYPVNVRQRR